MDSILARMAYPQLSPQDRVTAAVWSRDRYVDASLLASAKLQPGVTIWTRDKRLKKIAHELALAAILDH
jgi:predicted nucleic acid-binding protein